MNALYKVSPLVIGLNLESGETQWFRLPSEMARAGFIVSPLIQSTSDFALLYANENPLGGRVKSFSIRASAGDWLWKERYTVHFKNIAVVPRTGVVASLHLDKPVDAPADANIRVSEQCAGSIDSINGVLPSPLGFRREGYCRYADGLLFREKLRVCREMRYWSWATHGAG
ncbi:hypothetical protein ACFSUI_03765 [Ralstonia solanacearum]